ncbi:MAG: cytidine deaminase [Xanthomonadales bacterium]|nr:cytidine deaminase [Xanthomonadales bacterium]
MPFHPDDDRLIELAKTALQHSHAPYSGFHVGAALLSASGQLHSGCNVESAAYPLTSCAERAAVTAAVRAEGSSLRIVRAVVLARSDGQDRAASPCGGCRQLLWEFGHALQVVFRGADGELQCLPIDALLPAAFGLPR